MMWFRFTRVFSRKTVEIDTSVVQCLFYDIMFHKIIKNYFYDTIYVITQYVFKYRNHEMRSGYCEYKITPLMTKNVILCATVPRIITIRTDNVFAD